MAGVIKYDKKNSLGPVGVVRQSQGSDILGSAISKSADQFSGLLFERAAQNAKRIGRRNAASITQSELYGIGPDGKRDPYSSIEGLFSGGGTIQRQAFEATARQRFSDSIETDMQNKSAEISVEVDGKPDSTERFETMFSDYIASVTNTVGDEFKGFTTDTGSAYLASRRVSLLQAQEARRKAAIKKAAADRQARLLDIARQSGRDHGMTDVAAGKAVTTEAAKTKILEEVTVSTGANSEATIIGAAASGTKAGRAVTISRITGAFEKTIMNSANTIYGAGRSSEIRMAILYGNTDILTAKDLITYNRIMGHISNITTSERESIYSELGTLIGNKKEIIANKNAIELKNSQFANKAINLTFDQMKLNNNRDLNDGTFTESTDFLVDLDDVNKRRRAIENLQISTELGEAGISPVDQAAALSDIYAAENQVITAAIQNGLADLDLRADADPNVNMALLNKVQAALNSDDVDKLVELGIIKFNIEDPVELENATNDVKGLFRRANVDKSINSWFTSQEDFLKNQQELIQKNKRNWLASNQGEIFAKLEAAVGTTLVPTEQEAQGGMFDYVETTNISLKLRDINLAIDRYGPKELDESFQKNLAASVHAGEFNNLLSQLNLTDATITEINGLFTNKPVSETFGDSTIVGTTANAIVHFGSKLKEDKKSAIITNYYQAFKGEKNALVEMQKSNLALFDFQTKGQVVAMLRDARLSDVSALAGELAQAFDTGKYPDPKKAVDIDPMSPAVSEYGVGYNYRKKLFERYSNGPQTFSIDQKIAFTKVLRKEVGTRMLQDFSLSIGSLEELEAIKNYVTFNSFSIEDGNENGQVSRKVSLAAIKLKSVLQTYSDGDDLSTLFQEKIYQDRKEQLTDKAEQVRLAIINTQVLDPRVPNGQSAEETGKVMMQHFYPNGNMPVDIFKNAARILATEGPIDGKPATAEWNYLNAVVSNRDGVIPKIVTDYFINALNQTTLNQVNGVSVIDNVTNFWRSLSTYTDQDGVDQPNVFGGDTAMVKLIPMLNVLSRLEGLQVSDDEIFTTLTAYRKLNGESMTTVANYKENRDINIGIGATDFNSYIGNLLGSDFDTNPQVHDIVTAYANGLYQASLSSGDVDKSKFESQLTEFFESRFKEDNMIINTESSLRTMHDISTIDLFGDQTRVDAMVQFLHREFAGSVGGGDIDKYEGLQNVVIGAGDIPSSTFFAANPFLRREKSASSAKRFEGGRLTLGGDNMIREKGYLYLETSKNSTKGRGTASLVLVDVGGNISYPRYPAGHAKQGQRISVSTRDPEFNSFAETFTEKRNAFYAVVEEMNNEDKNGQTLQKGYDLSEDNRKAEEALKNISNIVRSVEETDIDVQKLRAAIFSLNNGEISKTEYKQREAVIIGSSETVYGLSVIEKANETVEKTNNDMSQVLIGSLIAGLIEDVGEYGGIKLDEAIAIISKAPFVSNKEEMIALLEARAEEPMFVASEGQYFPRTNLPIDGGLLKAAKSSSQGSELLADTLTSMETMSEQDRANFLTDPDIAKAWAEHSKDLELRPAAPAIQSTYGGQNPAGPSETGPNYKYPYQDLNIAGAKPVNDMATFQQILDGNRVQTFIAQTVDNMAATLSDGNSDVLRVDKAALRSVAVDQINALKRQATVNKRLESQNRTSLRAVLNRKDQDALQLKLDTERAEQALTFKTNRQKAVNTKALEFIAKQVKGGKISGIDFAEFKANAKPYYTAIWGTAFYTEDDIPDYFFVELEKLMKDK